MQIEKKSNPSPVVHPSDCQPADREQGGAARIDITRQPQASPGNGSKSFMRKWWLKVKMQSQVEKYE